MTDFFIARVHAVTPELLAAFERLMPQLTKAPIPTETELKNLLESSSVLVIARNGGDAGQIVGAAALGVFRSPSGLHAHIEDVIVDESLRGRGCGEALMRYLMQTAREIGLDGISLTCNPRRMAANQLYQKMGFTQWDTNVYWYNL